METHDHHKHGAEHRKRQRVTFHVSITIDVTGHQMKYEETNDISMGGVFVFTQFPLPVGDTGSFEIHLGDASDTEHNIKGKFRVASHGGKDDAAGMGLEFFEVDADSSVQLYNLVRTNTPDDAPPPSDVPAF